MQTKSNYKLLERLNIIRLLLSHIQNNPMKCRTAEHSQHSELYQDDNMFTMEEKVILIRREIKYLSNFIETLEMSYTVSLTKV